MSFLFDEILPEPVVAYIESRRNRDAVRLAAYMAQLSHFGCYITITAQKDNETLEEAHHAREMVIQLLRDIENYTAILHLNADLVNDTLG